MKSSGIAALLAVSVLAGCANDASGSESPSAANEPASEPQATEEANEPTRLAKVAEKCNLPTEGRPGPYALTKPALLDDDMTLVVDTQGMDETSGLSSYDLRCVLDELAIPGRIQSHLDSTRALDGVQTNSWDDLDAQWTYHPDSGLHLTIVDTQDGD